MSQRTPLVHTQAALLLGAACLGLASTAAAGELILLPPYPGVYLEGVNADGSFVSGYTPSECWYWTRETGIVVVPFLVPPGNGAGGHADVTATGRTMMSNVLVDIEGLVKSEACLYDASAKQITYCGSFGSNCDIERSGAWSMNPDGSIVVGLAWELGCQARGFVWKPQTGMLSLGTLYFYKPTRAEGVSDLGETIAGYNDDYNGFRQAAMWRYSGAGTSGYTQTNLVGPGNVKLRQATAVSGDGQWVAGFGRTSLDSGAPWRWHVTNGYTPMVPSPNPGMQGGVTALSHDGSRALVSFGVQGGGPGYLWTADGGYMSIADFAASHGIAVPPDIDLGLPMGFSGDEQVIVGTGINGSGLQVPFILDLHPTPPACTADLSGDGAVSGDDLALLLVAWGDCAEPCAADFDQDGMVSGLDLSVMLGSWGDCP